jgi:RIO kinase 1
MMLAHFFNIIGKSNPRKMVKVWAEKEMRNYKRLFAARIPCPTPILLKSHVLIMEFLGKNGWPSPRLKDANLSEKRMREAYVQTVVIMRRMFQTCRLVHGDLSEYNLLWHENEVYVIDVSQSVESDHPSALDFLRMDASNVNDFFRKTGGLNVMSTRQLFEFVTTPLEQDTLNAEQDCLDRIMQHVNDTTSRLNLQSEQSRREETQQEAVDEAVFMSQFLPRSLNQVADHEIKKLEEGEVEDTYARAVAALTGNHDVVEAVAKKTKRDTVMQTTAQSILSKSDTSDTEATLPDAAGTRGVTFQDDSFSGSEVSDGADSEVESDGASIEDEDADSGFLKSPKTSEQLHAEKEARRNERKANKKAVKEARSEKRQNKIKKKDKKRAIKKTKAGNRKN